MNDTASKIQYHLSIDEDEVLELHSEFISDKLVDAFDVELGENMDYDEFSKKRHSIDPRNDSGFLEIYELLEAFAYDNLQEALHSDYVTDRSEARRLVREAHEATSNDEQLVYEIAGNIRDYGPTKFFNKQEFQEDLYIRFVEATRIEVNEE